MLISVLPILSLNTLLWNRSHLVNNDVIMISEWQEKTHGTTYPSSGKIILFKTLRLHDQLEKINIIILGSSTIAGISNVHFPSTLVSYNFSVDGQKLSKTLDEAEWIVENARNIQWVFIPLDWGIGNLYWDDEPVPMDLSLSNTLSKAATYDKVHWSRVLVDSISFPKIVALYGILKNIIIDERDISLFKKYFLDPPYEIYHCKEGGISFSVNFDFIKEKTCAGYRYDGSGTFSHMPRVTEVNKFLLQGIAADSIFARSLLLKQGVPNHAMLNRLSIIAKKLKERGGKLFLIMPPLLPGFEKTFIRHEKFGPLLSKTKEVLKNFAEEEKLLIIDAGASEKYGCQANEFIDQHHATSDCYKRIFNWLSEKVLNDSELTKINEFGLIQP